MASLTLQMKIHLQTSALAYELCLLWCSVKQTLVTSDEIQVTYCKRVDAKKANILVFHKFK